MSSSAPSESPARATSAVGHDDAVVVAFTAPWCGHCRAMLPDLVAAAERTRAPRLELVDVTAAAGRAAAHGVTGTPTLVGLRAGAEVGRLVGRKGPAEVEAFFDAVAAGTRHQRSYSDLLVRVVGALIAGALGVMLDALPLVAFAGIVLIAAAVSDHRARRA